MEAIQGYMDSQPHPKRVDGLIECDRRIFEDDSWFCVVSREPLAEGHVRLICKHHVSDLGQLRGHSDGGMEPGVMDSIRSSLLDDLIISHDVVVGYDERIDLYFDIVPVYRFSPGTLHTLGAAASVFEDIPLVQKRKHWEQRRQDFEETGQRLREEAVRVLRGRPGRRRAGLRIGGE
jgi:hypothetical protein